MKKVLIGVSLLIVFLFSSLIYAGGGIAHMFVAEKAIENLPDPELRSLLMNNLDDYLVGSYYPDSGYVLGNQYGEDSHWDDFIYTFADYIKEKYPEPSLQNPKLVAFLFGCASHRVSDEIMHFTFYPILMSKDFRGNMNRAHKYGDVGIDLLLTIDKNRWQNFPRTWRVPVNDLLQVYHRMGKDQYKAEDLIRGNALISLAGFGERLIAIPAYLYLQWKMPWTANHYYNWPQGGLLMDKAKTIEYQMQLWQRLKDKSKGVAAPKRNAIAPYPDNLGDLPSLQFAEAALSSGAVAVTTRSNADGSVEIEQPIVSSVAKFQDLINKFIAKLKN